jgi:lysozyme
MKLLSTALLMWVLVAPARAAVICPGANTVQGVDVSHYQGSINWSAVKASGIAFAIASVGDGTYQDPDFAANWSGMKANGIIRGAYQYFEPGEDPGTQADILIGKIGHLGNGDLPATLDVEATGGQSAATITANIHTWVNKVQAATGKAPIIYTGKYFWNDNVGSGDFAGLPLWIAAYGVSCPDTPNAWGGWKMWQYGDAGSVGGISGGVDVDVFNGSLADLQVFAGGADWAAQFVSQSFPYASTAMTMTVGEEVAATLEMRNTGNKTWDASTRLGTSNPRDRASAFYDAKDWLAPNRLAQVSGSVAPGASYKFSFTFKAPPKPGTYFEYFDLVQEGVAWFSDPGQGGPPDDQLEVQIVVVEAPFHAEFVKQSFPLSQDGSLMLATGETADGWIDLKNVGTDTWKAGVTKLAPTPRDQASPLAAANWLSPTRVSTLAADVAPGETARFTLSLLGGAAGDYGQTFGLVEEGVTWFADAPQGGGPSDDLLRVNVTVHDAAGGGANPSLPGVGSGGPGGDGAGGGGGGGNGTTASGCAISGRGGGSPFMLALVLVMLAACRSRSARSRSQRRWRSSGE